MRRWIRCLLVTLGVLAFFSAVFSVVLYEQGYTVEGYLPYKTRLAEEYEPVLYVPPGDAPIAAFYMFNSSGSITYYFVWNGENTGKTLVDRAYSYMRSLFYGSSADVESITVVPDNRTVLFETTGHRAVVATFNGTTCMYNGAVIEDCTVNGTHVKVYVVTWNHLFSLEPVPGTVVADVKIHHMSPWDYVHYGIGRRNESIAAAARWAAFVSAVVTASFFLGVMYLRRRGVFERLKEKLRRWS